MELLRYTYKNGNDRTYEIQVSSTEIDASWRKFRVRAQSSPEEYCCYGFQPGGRLEVYNVDTGGIICKRVPRESLGAFGG